MAMSGTTAMTLKMLYIDGSQIEMPLPADAINPRIRCSDKLPLAKEDFMR
jgi:hypothetical protein